MSQYVEAWQRSDAALRDVLQHVEELIERLERQQRAPLSLPGSLAERLEERMHRCQERIESLRERRAALDAEIGQAEKLLLHYKAALAAEKDLADAGFEAPEHTAPEITPNL